MKKLKITLITCFSLILLGLFSPLYANESNPPTVENAVKELKDALSKDSGLCPVKKYLKTDNVEMCFKCHTTGKFELKESDPFEKYRLPEMATIRLFNNDGKTTMYYQLSDISDDAIRDIFAWLEWHQEITDVQIEIQSPGGSLMNAWRIVGVIERWKSQDAARSVETRVNGFAASAGLLIFMVGDIRAVSPTSELMWHELSISGYGYIKQSPSSSAEQARILNHLQKTTNQYISSKCNMSEDEIINSVKNGKELWVNGIEALELGIATKLLWENKNK